MRHLNNSLYLGPTRLKKSPKTGRKTAKNQQFKNAIFTHKNTPQPAWLRGFSHGDPGGIRTPDPRLRRPNINIPKNPHFMRFAGFENAFGANAGANAVRVRMLC